MYMALAIQYEQNHSLHRMQGVGLDCALHVRVYNLFLLLILGDTDCHNVLNFMPMKLKCRLLQYSASRPKLTEGFLHSCKSSFCLYICLVMEGNTWSDFPSSVVFVSQAAVMLWDVYSALIFCLFAITKERLKFNKI